MSRRFWRNLTAIALGHVALVAALLHWANASKTEQPAAVAWLSNADLPEPLVQSERAAEESPSAGPTTAPSTPTAKSEIELPTPISTPRPVVKPHLESTRSAEAKPKPKSTKPKIAASSSPASKRTGKPLAKTTEKVPRRTGSSVAKVASQPNGASGTSTTTANRTDSAWYSNMLHDRFYKAWEQPLTVVASGARLSAQARIRIEKDGRVSEFKIVQPSGNVVVDDSVQAVARRVSNVDAPPANLLSGGHYDVNVNFALNAE